MFIGDYCFHKESFFMLKILGKFIQNYPTNIFGGSISGQGLEMLFNI